MYLRAVIGGDNLRARQVAAHVKLSAYIHDVVCECEVGTFYLQRCVTADAYLAGWGVDVKISAIKHKDVDAVD